MIAAPTLTVTDRFARIMDGLCRAIAASQNRGLGPAPLVLLLWTRLRRTATRFATIAARVHAGAHGARRPRTHAGLGCEEGQDRGEGCCNRSKTVRPAGPRLPRAFGWLVRVAPAVNGYRSQLQHLLSDPEIEELLSAAPQLGRLLRPLCHMLAIKPSLNLLRRPSPVPARAHAPATRPPLAPSPQRHHPPPNPYPAPLPAFQRPARA